LKRSTTVTASLCEGLLGRIRQMEERIAAPEARPRKVLGGKYRAQRACGFSRQ